MKATKILPLLPLSIPLYVIYHLWLANPPPGTLIEKYHFPPHEVHVTHVSEGRGLCDLAPGDSSVYEVISFPIRINEQFILKLQSRKGPVCKLTSKEVWLNAKPGEQFRGPVYNLDVQW